MNESVVLRVHTEVLESTCCAKTNIMKRQAAKINYTVVGVLCHEKAQEYEIPK